MWNCEADLTANTVDDWVLPTDCKYYLMRNIWWIEKPTVLRIRKTTGHSRPIAKINWMRNIDQRVKCMMKMEKGKANEEEGVRHYKSWREPFKGCQYLWRTTPPCPGAGAGGRTRSKSNESIKFMVGFCIWGSLPAGSTGPLLLLLLFSKELLAPFLFNSSSLSSSAASLT